MEPVLWPAGFPGRLANFYSSVCTFSDSLPCHLSSVAEPVQLIKLGFRTFCCPRRAMGPCPIHQRPNERPRRSWPAHSRSSLCLVKLPTWSPGEQELGGELMLVVPAVPGTWMRCLGPSYHPLGPDAHSRVSSRQLAGIWGLLVTPGGPEMPHHSRQHCTSQPWRHHGDTAGTLFSLLSGNPVRKS
ncbi:uncharacterized protein LOC125089821 [Lutra lutra]|uniref:uncharacterized protein LOC125089821 n=1 Tax=Lutra lutra TaxID=9657 RepID=UPI001FD31906|nr:uncharacterized protein LOC125089821 [Lutra lutra]